MLLYLIIDIAGQALIENPGGRRIPPNSPYGLKSPHLT